MEQIKQIDAKNFKSGYIALIGKPNVGKSTLMNALLGQKLSIVTPKPQTTRHSILGILSEKTYQLIFIDTPGLLVPRYKLQDKMIKAAFRAIDEADIVLFLIDAEEKVGVALEETLSKIIAKKKSVILAINKIDLIDKNQLLPLVEKLTIKFHASEIVPISALKKDGLTELHQLLMLHLPTGLPFYPLDIITEHPERFFVSEIIREKIFENYSDEIPYSTTVLVEEFKERENRKDYIRANIVVEKDSQKGILIGKQGAALKNIGQLSRQDIEHFLGRPVYLELFVKVREKWRQKEAFLKEFGY